MSLKSDDGWIMTGQIQPYTTILERLKSVSNSDEYYDVIVFAYGCWSAADAAHFIVSSWRSVPDCVFYKAWTSALCDDRGYYNMLFKPEIIARVMKTKQPYVDENKVLLDLLDDDGYLTVYHGHSKKTLNGSNSWSLNREIADWFGRRNADGRHNRKGQSCDTYWVAAGKVKLADVIAFITNRNEDEIVVLNRNVKKVDKQIYPFDRNTDMTNPPPIFPAGTER